jgi:hypothetical protein
MAKHFDDEHIKLTLEQGIISVEYSEGGDDWAFGFEHLGELIKNLQRAQAWLKEQEKKKGEPKVYTCGFCRKRVPEYDIHSCYRS